MSKLCLGMLFVTLLCFGEQQEPEVIVSPPNPAELKANWWSYYEVDPERLGVRIGKTQEIFDHLGGDLSLEQRELALPLMQQILVGLKTYLDLSKERVSQAPVEEHRQETYSFHDFLALIDQLNNQKLFQDSILHQQKIEKGNLRTDQSSIDAMTASYLSSSKTDLGRVIKGLKIMSRRVAIEVDKKKLTILEQQIGRGKKSIQALEEEILFAQKNIDTEGFNIAVLQRELEIRQGELSQAQETLLQVQAKVANNRSLIASEEILFFTLKRAEIETKIIETRLKLTLGQILTQPERKSIQTLYQQLTSIEEEMGMIQIEIGDWKSAANLYLELALSSGHSDAVTLAQKIGMLVQRVERQSQYNKDLFQQCDALIHTYYVSFKDRVIDYWESLALRWKRYSKWSHNSMFKIGQTPITFYGLLKVVFIIICAYFFAKFIQLWIKRFGSKQKRINQAGIYTLGRLTYYVILIIGIIIAISGIGLDFTTFAVIAGALSVGIGFGLQSIVNNFVSGIIVLLEKKLRVRDLIQLESGEIGRVIEINVRTTLIRTFDNLEILVPNADLVSKKFINWTLSDQTRRIRVPFGVAFGSDKNKVRDAAIEAALEIPMTVKEKEPQVWLTKIGESSLDFELVVWVNESLVGSPPMGTLAWYTWEVESALNRHNITIPFPVRDINLKSNK